MQISLLIALLATLALVNYRVSRSVLYPPFLFCIMWLLVFSIYQCNFMTVDPIHTETLLVVGFGAFLFSLGGGIAALFPRQVVTTRFTWRSPLRVPEENHLVKYLLVVGCFIGMLLVLHNTIVLGASGNGGTFLARARSSGVEGQNQGSSQTFTLLTYVPVWSIYAATLFLVEKKNRLFWIMAWIAFLTAIFTTGRSPILLLFCSLIAVQLLKEKKDNITRALKFVRIPLLGFFALYTALTFSNKDTSGVSGGFSGVLIYFVIGYLVSPVAAFDHVLQNASSYANEPNHTLKFVLGIASKLHLLSFTPPPLLDSFVEVPFPTNVYTGYKFFFTDFGIYWCFVLVMCIGFLHTLLYRKAKSGSELGLYCFALTVFPIVMFVFDDLYSAIGEDINIFLFGALYFTLRRLALTPGRPFAYRKLFLNA